MLSTDGLDGPVIVNRFGNPACASPRYVRGPADQVRARLAALAADEQRGDADREAARSFLPFLGGDDPGAATDVPRSRVEEGPPPTYTLSDERNAPPAP